MLSVFLVSFREYIESLIIIGILLGFSKKNDFKKENEIIMGALFGFIFSFFLILAGFTFGNQVTKIFGDEQIEFIESILMICSGVFLLYVTVSLQPLIHIHKETKLNILLKKNEAGNRSFVLPSFFLILQEGIEIAVFAGSSALTKTVISNVLGLLSGLIGAIIIGFIFYKTYLRAHIGKLFKFTEVLFIIYSLYLIFSGVTKLLEIGGIIK